MSRTEPKKLFEDELRCPLCLDFFSEPQLLPCGHNLCDSCVQKLIQQDSGVPRHRCPECRREFDGRSALKLNFKLCNLIESFKSSYSEPQVLCDTCLGNADPAVRTCLKCEISMCALHLKPHLERSAFKSHVLVEPTADLSARKCPLHEETLKYYCFEDKTCMCVSCTVEGEHRNHNVKSLKKTRDELKVDLKIKINDITETLKLAEELFEKGKAYATSVKGSNAHMKLSATDVFDHIIELANTYKERIVEIIEKEHHVLEMSAQEHVVALSEKREELQKIKRQAESVLAEKDEFLFIQQHLDTQNRVTQALEESLRGLEEKPLNRKLILEVLGAMFSQFQAEVGKGHQALRNEVHPAQLSLDPDTAHPHLILSEDLKTVRYTKEKQPYPGLPERFDRWHQVLSHQGFSSGEHYWEVDVGNGAWSLGISYQNIGRKGDGKDICLGVNAVSWALRWWNSKLSVWHNKISTFLPSTSQPAKIGVHVDISAGTLSFHSVADQLVHIYTFKTKFTQPVYPAFWVLSDEPLFWLTVRSVSSCNLPKVEAVQ
ncbi:tripartite motif-containing protein 16-like [Lepisosteus oculatus]|uniref:tripartite motif-containing protein 16-like n=1 Tax=Lepisosteus oculatus TaxID=7918 RepID=UPI0037241F20